MISRSFWTKAPFHLSVLFTPCLGFTTGIPQVQISNTVPLPVNTVTVVGEGMTPYMFGYSVISKKKQTTMLPIIASVSRSPQAASPHRCCSHASMNAGSACGCQSMRPSPRWAEGWGDRTMAQALRERAGAAMRWPREWVKWASWCLMTWYSKWGWA